MPATHFRQLVLDLSTQVQDPRTVIGESDTNHDYTEAILALAVNRGIRDFINTMVKDKPDEVDKILPEYCREVSISIPYNVPSDSIKVLQVRGLIGVDLKDWEALQSPSYNPEEDPNNANAKGVWCEFDGKVNMMNYSPTDKVIMYVRTQPTVGVNDATDIVINARFDNQILDLAETWLLKKSPIT